MQKNVLIGIGGTGSKVIESVIHMCAAGLGPDKLNIFMIDPDRGNGNLTRTQTLIKRYTELRDNLQKTPDNPCFKTEIIIPPGDEPLTWNILEDSNYTLAKYINYDNISKVNPPLANLANVLFTGLELETSLERGFRGHPSIGAVVMADPPMDQYPFKLLWDGIESLGENELRVFIVGSIFGGTGAAGFPTLGANQLIKYNEAMHAKLSNDRSRVLLGGALILPYFSFSVENTANESMFVTASDFPIATKAALQYYNDKDLGFDQYYFIGDSLSQKVGKFSTGSSTQENQPHYIELVSGLACFDFFDQPADSSLSDKKYFIASRETEQLSWNTLPLTRDSGKLHNDIKGFKKLMTNFTIFSYTYLTFGKSILSKSHKEVGLEAWYSLNYKSQFQLDNKLYNPRHNENSTLYKIADEYLNSFLFWICSLDDHDKMSLIDSTKLLAGDIPDDKKLKLLNPEEFKANIGQIVKEDAKPSSLDFNAFKVRGLGAVSIQDGTLFAGSKYLNIFYAAAAIFNEKNTVNS